MKLPPLALAGFAAFLLAGQAMAAGIIDYPAPRLMNPAPGAECFSTSGGAGVSIKSDVKLLEKCYPGVPEECWAGLKFRAEVRFLIDIDREGLPQNIRIVETTYECLNEEAASAVSHWKFKNEGVEMKDVKARIRFVNHGNLHEREQVFEDLRRY